MSHRENHKDRSICSLTLHEKLMTSGSNRSHGSLLQIMRGRKLMHLNVSMTIWIAWSCFSVLPNRLMYKMTEQLFKALSCITVTPPVTNNKNNHLSELLKSLGWRLFVLSSNILVWHSNRTEAITRVFLQLKAFFSIARTFIFFITNTVSVANRRFFMNYRHDENLKPL